VFEGGTVIEVCSRHLHAPPTPPSERLGRPVSETLSALILACLEKDPDRRPPSARAFIAALDACDVPPWTDDQARSWWSSESARILARAAASEVPPPAGISSVIRRADAVTSHAVDFR
jgi:eukaryotic-like serine/threonine-protein kinase